MLRDVTDDLLEMEEEAYIAHQKILESLRNDTVSVFTANRQLHLDTVTNRMNRVAYLGGIAAGAGIKSDAGKTVKETVFQDMSPEQICELMDKKVAVAKEEAKSEGT